MTRNWFTCVVKYTRHGADGVEEKTTDQLLLDALGEDSTPSSRAVVSLISVFKEGEVDQYPFDLVEAVQFCCNASCPLNDVPLKTRNIFSHVKHDQRH